MWPKLSKKYSEGYDERRGAESAEKIASFRGRRPFWIHGVSVGEVQACVPLIRAAREAGFDGPVVLSTTTETGRAMAQRLGEGLFDAHIYYPWDKSAFVKSAVSALNPWAFATAETELWPNMLWCLRDAGIPRFLVNGRISDRTWKRLSGPVGRRVGRELYELFTNIFLRDERDAERLRGIGVAESSLRVFGDSKIDALLARRNPASRDSWIERLGQPERRIFMAGSTHEGEDEKVMEAFDILRASDPKARLIIAPRHPERAAEVEKLAACKYEVCRASRIFSGWDVLVVDKIGVLFDLYGVSTAAFVGGSFADKGGQNILEPVSWGVPVQYGPHMEDFAAASAEFLRMGIASQVSDGAELGRIWTDIVQNSDNDIKYKQISKDYFARTAGAAAKTWNEIIKFYGR